MAAVTADPARELTIYFRINRDGSITFTFYDANEAPFDLSGYTFVLNFKLRKADSTNILQLTSGSGLTISGNNVVAALTATQSTAFREQTYFWELVRTNSGLVKDWLTGDAIFHFGKFDGVEKKNSYTPSDDSVTITITEDQFVYVTIGDSASTLIKLNQVLFNGNDGGALQIKNIADPTDAQDALTLEYFNSHSGGGGAVSSVFGRTGAVVAATNDYSAAQITNAVSTLGSYANPSWITSLAYSKLTGAPTALSSFSNDVGYITTIAGILAGGDLSGTYVNPTVSKIKGNVVPANAVGVLTNDGAGVLSWSTASTGSVTSVAQSFTGGLISVGGSPITTSGTLALTVAGTSGGVPYFSSTSTWASSTLLAANALMIGGGVGAAPSTTATAAGILTWLGTPSSANLRSALTDENGTGAALFSGATTPDFTTGFTIGAAAASGKFIVGNGTNYIPSTSTIPTSAGATANKVLLSNGTNYVLSTPTFPNASATVRKKIVSDGTNWVASTETWAIPGTSGNLLTSDGTNWLSSAATFWSLATGGTLTAANTITHNTANWLTFASTWPASANNQYARQYNATITSRGTASDVVMGDDYNYTITAASTSIDAQPFSVASNFKTSSGITTVQGVSGASFVSRTTTGMTATTYTSIAPASTSGVGTGALFTVIVSSAINFTSFTPTTAGSGYSIGETITFNGSQFGSGSGSVVMGITGTTNGFLTTIPSISIIQNNFPDFSSSSKGYISGRNSSGAEIWSIGALYPAGTGTTTAGMYFTDQTGTFLSTTSTQANFGGRSVMSTSPLFSGTTTMAVVTTSGANTFTNTGGDATSLNASVLIFTGNPQISVASQLKSYIRGTGGIKVGVPATYSIQTAGSGYANGAATTTGGSGTLAALTLTTSGGTITAAVPLSGSGTGSGSGYAVNDILNVVMAGGSSGQVKVTAIDGFGGIVSMVADSRSITEATSNNIYASYYANPTYNLTGTFTGKTALAWYAPTMTSNTGSRYGVVIASTSDLSGFGTITPTATVTIGAGTTAIGPLQLTSGTNLTSPLNGMFEFNGTTLFFTRSGTTRESILTSAAGGAAPSTTATPTFTSYYGGNTKALGDPTDWIYVVINGVTKKIPAY